MIGIARLKHLSKMFPTHWPKWAILNAAFECFRATYLLFIAICHKNGTDKPWSQGTLKQ